MSNSTTLSLNQLPLDILHHIYYHLDVADIMRIRRVSRYLNEASRYRNVWSDAYRTAEFVRPPGPFPLQSARDLENTLVSCFRVDRNLHHGSGSAQTERSTRKLREIRYADVEHRASLIFGQFLLVAFSKEVRCYALNTDAFDSNLDGSIIYRSTDGILRSSHCVSAIDIKGRPFTCMVLNEAIQTTRQISVYSLNVGEHSEVTLSLLHQFEHSALNVNAVNLGPRVIIIQGQLGDDSAADWHIVTLDVDTRTQFLLPSLTCAKAEAAEMTEFTGTEAVILLRSISTSTHLLLTWSCFQLATGRWRTFFQVFALPPSGIHDHFAYTPTPLNLSHRGVLPDISTSGIMLLHDSILDPATQDILIAIRVHAYPYLPQHGILRLHNTLTCHDHEVGSITLQLLGSLGQFSLTSFPFLHQSFNGMGRAFYTLSENLHEVVSVLEYDLNASGNDDKQEAKVVEYPSILRFPTQHVLLDYDPYFGQICLRSSIPGYNVIEIFDLAV